MCKGRRKKRPFYGNNFQEVNWMIGQLVYVWHFQMFTLLKGKLGEIFLLAQSFYQPQTKRSLKRQFSPKSPEVGDNQDDDKDTHKDKYKDKDETRSFNKKVFLYT